MRITRSDCLDCANAQKIARIGLGGLELRALRTRLRIDPRYPRRVSPMR
jgi:hypothetical protein